MREDSRCLYNSDDSKDTPFESFYNPQISILNSPSIDFLTEYSGIDLVSYVEPSEIVNNRPNRFDFIF
jgi:hypothetical protein